jgi:osmotically-inducible protein OsmY
MSNYRRAGLFPGALVCIACLGGCSGEDKEHLAGVGRKVAEHLQGVGDEAGTRLARGWQAARNADDDLPLDTRLSVRLRYDKNLSGAAIAVMANGAEVELRGKVRDAEQHRRALDLAESTTGVEKVNDALEESKEDP